MMHMFLTNYIKGEKIHERQSRLNCLNSINYFIKYIENIMDINKTLGNTPGLF